MVRGVPLATLKSPVGGPRSTQCRHVGPGHVADVHEVAPLRPVLKDQRCLATIDGAQKETGDTGVWRVERGAWAVDIVIAQGHDRTAGLTPEYPAEVLLLHFRGGVDVARVTWRALTDGRRLEVLAAVGARGFERAGLEAFSPSRYWLDGSATPAPVRPLSVDDHAAGQHKAATEMASSEFPQQSGRRQVVVLHVLGDVVEMQAEADLRRLVADGLGAFEDISPPLRLVQIGAPVVGLLGSDDLEPPCL